MSDTQTTTPTQVSPVYLVILKDEATKILNYLATKPYNEVHELANALRNLPVVNLVNKAKEEASASTQDAPAAQ
jgi:hypothetical protein